MVVFICQFQRANHFLVLFALGLVIPLEFVLVCSWSNTPNFIWVTFQSVAILVDVDHFWMYILFHYLDFVPFNPHSIYQFQLQPMYIDFLSCTPVDTDLIAVCLIYIFQQLRKYICSDYCYKDQHFGHKGDIIILILIIVRC